MHKNQSEAGQEFVALYGWVARVEEVNLNNLISDFAQVHVDLDYVQREEA